MTCSEREQRIRDLFPMVKCIAARIHRMVPGSDRGDLVGDGCVGLIRAVDAFDPQRGVPLEKYAARVVAGAILNGIRRLDPVPERVRREVRMGDRERYDLAAARGVFPSQREMESRRPKLRRALALAVRYTPLSLDGPLPYGERLTEDWSGDPARIFGARGWRIEMHAAIHALPRRQREVIALHYLHGRSLRQIGRLMQISAQRTSQLHIAGIKKLKACLHASR